MESDLKNLPEDVAKVLETNLNGNKIWDSATESVELIFDCASKNPDKIAYLESILKFKTKNNAVYHRELLYKNAIEKCVENILIHFINTDGMELIEGSSDWNKIKFISALGVSKITSPKSYIKKLLTPLWCECLRIKFSKCLKRNCGDDTIDLKNIRVLRTKSEYPTQCAIAFLGSSELFKMHSELKDFYSYWCGRLEKFEPYFENTTQKMIQDLVKCVNELTHFERQQIAKITLFEEEDENEKKMELMKKLEQSDETIKKLEKERERTKLKIEKALLEKNTIINEAGLEKQKLVEENKQLKDRIEKIIQAYTELKNSSEKETITMEETIQSLKTEKDQLKTECVVLKSKLRQEADRIMDYKVKIEELEKLIENQSNSDTPIKNETVRRIHQKYEKILKADNDIQLSQIISNLDRLVQIRPDSIDILLMKVEILKINKEKEQVLEKINEDYWRIERNPEISMYELGNEVDIMPNEEFMEKYEKLMAENNIA